ncbi:MAG: hypothetical protein ABL908_10530 [Hyphomicrobium sp.]
MTIVPLSYQSTADLMPAVKTISALQPHCETILVLINNTAPEHVQDLIGILAVRFPKLPVLVVNRSRHVSRLADDGLTVIDIAEMGGLEAYQLRHILPQIKKLYGFLDKHSKHYPLTNHPHEERHHGEGHPPRRQDQGKTREGRYRPA